VNPPEVSILLPCRNAQDTVDRAIASIVNQSFRDWELICGDDLSSDATLARLRAWQAHDSRVVVLASPVRLGVPRLLNKLLSVASGEFVARQDADDVSLPRRLERQVNVLTQWPDIDLVGSWMIDISPTRQQPIVFVAPPEHEQIVAHPYRLTPLYHPTFCGRREWFQRFCYDPRHPATQDQELLLRSHRSSRFANVQEVLVGYTQREFAFGNIARRRMGFLRCVWRDAWEHRQLIGAGRATARHLGALSVNSVSAILRWRVPTGWRSHTRVATDAEAATLRRLPCL
jgi:glycosyltransferase involved in cell wall biosynthesis